MQPDHIDSRAARSQTMLLGRGRCWNCRKLIEAKRHLQAHCCVTTLDCDSHHIARCVLINLGKEIGGVFNLRRINAQDEITLLDPSNVSGTTSNHCGDVDALESSATHHGSVR